MTADDAQIARAPLRGAEPRQDVRAARPAILPLNFSSSVPVGAAEAQAREAVGDEAQAIDAAQIVRPAIRLIAVHVREQLAGYASSSRNACFEFARARLRRRKIPLRRQAGVDHRVAERRRRDEAAAASAASQQLVAIRRLEDLAERVLAA